MFEDLARLDDGQTIEADLCIVGAGAAGIAIACAFIGQNLKICLVESGNFDFEPDTQALYAGSSVGRPVALDAGRLRMFGGTTNHWGGRCAEFSRSELAERAWVPHSGWPIGLETLSPYYERARGVCGFAGPWPARDETFRSLGLDPALAAPGPVETQLWRFAPHDGGIFWNFGASYRRTLERADNVHVLLHANLVGFVTDPQARHVERIDLKSLSGKTASVRAHRFTLCAGGIENARLLLLPGENRPAGLGNGGDLVGRYFMQHLRLKAGTVAVADRLSPLQDLYNDFTGPDGVQNEIGATLSDQAQREAQILNCSAVFQYEGDPMAGSTAAQDIWRRLREGRWADDLGTKIWRVIGDLPAFEANAERWLRTGRHPLLPIEAAGVVADLEQLPDPESRVRLGPERDALGLPQVVADWRVSDLERDTARKFMALLGRDLGARGLGRLQANPALDRPGDSWTAAIAETYHYLGTTRMAADPSQGVVDTDCKIFGMDNLYVAGSSVFPTGGHVNPTLTITALALRLSDHLRDILVSVR